MPLYETKIWHQPQLRIVSENDAPECGFKFLSPIELDLQESEKQKCSSGLQSLAPALSFFSPTSHLELIFQFPLPPFSLKQAAQLSYFAPAAAVQEC